jgi:Na+-transporting methylmalonyl-CoA/oxaloacetate decarboxylase gamma subunit
MDFAAFLSNLGNNLGFGLIVTLIGMLTVFFGLVLLIGLIKLMENATANLGKGGKKGKRRFPFGF